MLEDLECPPVGRSAGTVFAYAHAWAQEIPNESKGLLHQIIFRVVPAQSRMGPTSSDDDLVRINLDRHRETALGLGRNVEDAMIFIRIDRPVMLNLWKV